MANTRQVILDNISFTRPNSNVNFNNITLSFNCYKYGIVGKNGVGKTTFLKLILEELKPDSGSITIPNMHYVQQDHQAIVQQATIADVLGVTHILQSLRHIQQGSTNAHEFKILENNWNIEQRIADALSTFYLWPLDLEQRFHLLSGGQKTKVLLARTLIFPADFLIFDEPTNNLDNDARHILYNYITQLTSGAIIVSHDRKLLNQCDKILEITTKGINTYGGNYDFYQDKKLEKQQAIIHEIKSTTDKLNKSKKVIQTRMERHAQGQARGREKIKNQIKAKGSYDKIELKSKKGKSENTNRRIRLQAERTLDTLNDELATAHEQIEVNKPFSINLPNTAVPNNKCMLNINALSFGYNEEKTLINHFNFELVGAARVAIVGANGCGKSTLIQLILGNLKPKSGEINIGASHLVYLDQNVSFLENEISLVDNFLKLNSTAKRFEAYSTLAAFKFRNKDAEKLISSLSGGERMRAGLAMTLMSIEAPQLIILDEPTNHLDLEAIEAVELALKAYQGAILAVSHDQQFLENINIDSYVRL